MPETKDLRQMSPDEVYSTYIKPYWQYILILEFIVTPAIILTCYYALGNRPSGTIPMLIVYLVLDISDIVIKGRSLGGVRFR